MDNSVRMRILGSNLASKDWIGKGDKYLVIKRQRGDGHFEEVLRTEVMMAAFGFRQA